MPAYWSKKDERQYQHIKKSCMAGRRRTGRTTADCKRVAASTVNKQRRKEGRTLTGLQDEKVCAHPVGLGLGGLGIFVAGVALASWLKKGDGKVSGCTSC